MVEPYGSLKQLQSVHTRMVRECLHSEIRTLEPIGGHPLYFAIECLYYLTERFLITACRTCTVDDELIWIGDSLY